MGASRILAPIIVLAAAACGVATPLQVATLRSAPAPASVGLDSIGPEDPPGPAMTRVFRGGLVAALSERAVQFDPASRYRLAIGFAVRPADAGVGRIEGDNIDWSSQPRRHRWFHACQAQRVHATVALRDSESGEVIGRWRGGFDDCAPAEEQVRELAARFAAAIVNR